MNLIQMFKRGDNDLPKRSIDAPKKHGEVKKESHRRSTFSKNTSRSVSSSEEGEEDEYLESDNDMD